MNKPIAWSHSVLESFETCAYRHYLTKVTKEVVEGQSAEMAAGNHVHRALEHRVKNGTPLPADVPYEGIATRLLKAAVGGKIEAEQKMALDANFNPVSFFSKQPAVWVRSITDVTITKGDRALILDYKTGKPKHNSEQLKLSAVVTFHHLPWIKEITNSFMWLKTGEVTKDKFTREDMPAIWQGFFPRVQRLEIAYAENKWPKKPSGLCKNWCPVPHSKCEHR